MKAGHVLAERYRLVERLGEGGMGEIWRAEQVALGRDVAVKMVRADYRGASTEATERFRREAALIAKVDHRNVVDVVDYGTEPDGTQYLVMPLLPGETLLERTSRPEPPTLGELLTWIRGVLGGLAAIHGRGIVHRDLKPANVFLARDDDGVIPKLIDFGISRPAEGGGASLTEPGGGMGTPQYMAPEQFESAKNVDARADVWGVGAMLYEALTGRRPYEGESAFAIYKAVLQGPPTPLAQLREDLAPGLVAFVQRALERDPNERYPDAASMREALDALLASKAVPEATLARSVVAGARVPRTAAMDDRDERPVSGDAPTEPAEGLTPTPPSPVAARTVPLAAPASTSPRPAAFLWLGAAVAVVVAGALIYDVLDREPDVAPPAPPTESSAPPEADLEPIVAPPPETEGDAIPDPAADVVVSAPRELSSLALAWAELGAEARARDLRFAERAGQWVLVAPADLAPETFAALGGFATPYEDGGEELRPRLMRSTVRLSVHTQPSLDAPDAKILPHHAVVIALEPDAPDDDDEDDEALRRVVVAAGASGWVLARFLEPVEGCLPRTESLVATVGANARDIVERATRIRTWARIDGARQDVLVLAGSDLERHAGHVRVFSVDRGCAIHELGAHDLGGVIDEVFLTETIPDGGQTLLVTSTAPPDTRGSDGVLLWEARPIAGGAPLWSERLATGPGLPASRRASVVGTRDRIARSRRAPFVLSFRRPGEGRAWLVFRGGEIVAEAAEPASDPASDPAEP
ncbi:MAG: protein kinase [Sandaracinaceae bacterium]|nr:protein kinase [Sandaracinaceae bacterium]